MMNENLLDGNNISRARPKIIKKFGHPLFSIGISPERIDDPHLAKMDGRGQSSALGIARDELDVLNSTTLPFR